MTEVRLNRAAWILSLALEPARARELASELAQANVSRPPGVFWAAVLRTTVISAIRQIGGAPWIMTGLVLAAYGASLALGLALMVMPQSLVLRPDDGSLLSSWWIRHAAALCSSRWGAAILQYVVAPFLLGGIVACFARGRTLAAFAAVLISGIALEIIAREYAVHLGAYRLADILVYVPRDFGLVLLGAIAARIWMLRHASA